MPLDIVIFGVAMPTLLPFFFFIAIMQILIDRAMSRMNIYNYVWHPGLFRTAIFVSLFTLPCLIIYK